MRPSQGWEAGPIPVSRSISKVFIWAESEYPTIRSMALIKLLSLNVALFEKNNEKLARFIMMQAPDILSLQEVTRRVDVSANREFISMNSIDVATSKLTESFFAPVWLLSKFEKNDFHGKEHFVVDFKGKIEFGNLLKSRYPITKGQNIFVQNQFSYVTDWSKWPEEDYRAVQVSDLEIDGKKVRVLNYHGIWTKDKRGTDKTKAACEVIKKLALEVDYPAIITGDFNLFPDTESIGVFTPELKNLVNEFEIKTTRPATNELSAAERNVVDYVFVTKGVTVKKFEVLEVDVSDHLPLVLEFEL